MKLPAPRWLKSILGGTETLSGGALFYNDDKDVAYKTSPLALLKYNELNLYVNRAIAKRAQKVGEVKFVLKKGEKEIEENPLLELLNRPNQFHTGSQFWKLYQKHLDLTGSAFIFLEKQRELFAGSPIKGLHLMRPDLVRVLYSEDHMEIVGYEYSKPNGDHALYTPEDVIFTFNPDPMNPLKGESLIRSGVRQIETDLSLTDYQNKVIKNGGKVDAVFSFKTANLTQKQVEDMRTRYIEQRSGGSDAGVPLFLGGDSKYENIGLSPAELGYLESKKATLNDIVIMTGVPHALLSVTNEQTYANADAAMTTFLRDTIKPLLEDLTQFLDWRLIPEGYDLSFVDPTPEDIERKVKLLKTASEVSAVTTNEKREMLDLDPLPGKEADMILVPFSVTPLERATEEPEPAPQTVPEEDAEKAKRKFVHPLSDDYFRKKYGTLQLKRLERRESDALRRIRAYFEAQEQRLISQLEDPAQKGIMQKRELLSMFDEQLEVKIARDTILPLIQEALMQAGMDAVTLFESGYDFTLTSAIASWLDTRADFFSRGVTSTTVKDLTKAFQESIDAGEGFTDTVERIRAIYKDYSNARALAIARTEIHGAMQHGTIEAYRQVGSPVKIWVWAAGDQGGVREDHVTMDGKEMPLDMPFELPSGTKAMYPGGSGDPSEDINCACSI